MEATKERVGLLDKILPPALADAGLEDCALPPESIQEAFRKAADAVKSRAASLFESEEEAGCVADPLPGAKGTSPGDSDTVIVGGGNGEETGPCLAGKGNGKLADSGMNGDDLVVAGEGGQGKSCGDGLKDLDVEGIDSSKDENEEDDMKPILVGGFV
ncbi:hypothetical protein AALP_AA1G171600 [Arabis alpina]|uniref:Uncharacterized protein n=1 Tax=Arabis alpina TaxID=50452 RepID=A0A087HNS8_ARAAL|nr:hypothetical protein AALP_AA1G171600 [Arabis alpina]